jgi:DNA (cytosine-5)-methyltransferase 1
MVSIIFKTRKHQGKQGKFAIAIYNTDSPMTVKIKDFMSLYGLIDVRMRMLRIPELKRIMGFPSDYILKGTQSDQKKYIGNAVETHMACALCEALYLSLSEKKTKTA